MRTSVASEASPAKLPARAFEPDEPQPESAAKRVPPNYLGGVESSGGCTGRAQRYFRSRPAYPMRLGHVTVLEDFGARSLLIHGIMVVVFANAILVGLLVEGLVGVATFVALLNFTAGLWIAHSVH